MSNQPAGDGPDSAADKSPLAGASAGAPDQGAGCRADTTAGQGSGARPVPVPYGVSQPVSASANTPNINTTMYVFILQLLWLVRHSNACEYSLKPLVARLR